MKAIARLDWGRWLADCPAPNCTNAMPLEIGQQQFNCRYLIDPQRQAYGGCGTTAPVEWPPDPGTIQADLAAEPEGKQNWRPDE